MSNDNNELLDRIIEKYSNKKNLPVKNHSICVKTNNCAYDIIRLDDNQYHILINYSIPISEDYSQLMSLYKNDKLIYSSFSKMYTALSMLFGENGKYFDGWKGSFSFPLLIHFHHNGQEFEYLMNIHNIRSSIEFGLRKLVTPNDNIYEKDAIHESFEEFPREEILYFINYLVGFNFSNYLDQVIIKQDIIRP